MNKKIILVDYENIQKIDELEKLTGYDIKILVGSNQNKISLELVQKFQKFGENVEWIQVPAQGKNALDFFIAYFLGKFIECKKYDYYYIISKDSGYDPLITFLNEKNTIVERIVSVKQLLETKNIILEPEILKPYIENLKKLASNKRPKKKETLIKNFINAFRDKTETEIQNIVEEMFICEYLTEENGKLKYTLNK